MKDWFLAGGDFGFFWPEQIRSLSWLPKPYQTDMGFGLLRLDVMWFSYPYSLIVKILNLIGLSWWGIEKLLWISVLVVGIYSSYRLGVYIFKSRPYSWITSFIYMTNTYFLLLVGGRQLGVALAYAFSPFILYRFIRLIDQIGHIESSWFLVPGSWRNIKKQRSKFKEQIANGLLFALLVCFDIRLAYLVLIAIGIYALLCVWSRGFTLRDTICHMLNTLAIPLSIAMVIHLYWILPTILVSTGVPFIGEDFTNIGMLRFLSVADFSHALSLLHPNWPENLFGKVYFLQPEFLALPLLAFGGLLWIGKARKTGDNEQKTERVGQGTMSMGQERILFFAFISLLGTFLAKGAQEPFGGAYVFLFEHVPGFVMFRDPTKFYLYIAIGYSILIPYALSHIINVVLRISNYELRITSFEHKIIRSSLSVLCCLLFITYWIFTIRAVFIGETSKIFKPLELTHEYTELKDMLVNDRKQNRILWIPSSDKFIYSSDIHPVLSADTLWKNASAGALLSVINNPDFFQRIEDAGVRYIVVPQDLEERIFLSDYRYDIHLRDTLINALDQAGLPRLLEYEGLAIFENPVYTFKIEKPAYVQKQEYWAKIGLVIGGFTFIFLVSFMWMCSKKNLD